MIEWIIECLNSAEAFFAQYRNTAYATGTLLALIGLSVTLYKLHIKKVLERGNLDLRHEFQAGYFDIQEARYDKLLEKYDALNGKYNKILLHIVSKKSK